MPPEYLAELEDRAKELSKIKEGYVKDIAYTKDNCDLALRIANDPNLGYTEKTLFLGALS